MFMHCTWISINNMLAMQFKYDFLIGWKVLQDLFLNNKLYSYVLTKYSNIWRLAFFLFLLTHLLSDI
jgi:hypothetical protein